MQTLDNEVNSQRFSDLLSQTGDNEDNSQRSSILQSETGSNRDISQRDTEDNSQSSNDESSQGEDNVRDNTNDAEDNTNDAEDNANNAEDNTNNAEDNNNNAEDNTNDTEDNTNDTEDNINDTEDNTNDTEDNQEDESDNTLPREKFKYMNIFLHPEEASSEDINNLIYCTKTQFLEYAESLRPYQSKINRGRQGRKSNLSLYSRAFLFRLKIASNLSFKKLATLFVICKSTALKIYNNILGVSYQFLSSIPNVLKGDEEVEKLYKGAYEAMDPFYKKLFEPFADPKGNFDSQLEKKWFN
jgi:cobalamin biosynthesis protein CobT